MDEHSSDNKNEAVGLHVNALLEEYRAIRELANKHIEWQSQLDALVLAGLGASIPFILALLNANANAIGAMLLLPILFFATAFVQLRHERLLTNSAVYIDAELRPRLNKLLSRYAGSKVNVLGYEQFLGRKRWLKSLFLGWLATASHALLAFATGISIIVIYLYLRFAFFRSNPWYSFETWLLVVNGLILLGDVLIALTIARQRYRHYSSQNYFKND